MLAAVLAFVVIPNLIFALVGRVIMINRAWISIDYALLGALWLFLPVLVRRTAFVFVVLLDLIGSTAAIYNIGSFQALVMLRYAPPKVLTGTAAGLVFLVVAFVFNVWFAWRTVRGHRVAVAVVLVLAAAAAFTTDAVLGGSRFIAVKNRHDINVSASSTVRFILDSRERVRAERKDPVLMRAASDSLRAFHYIPHNNILVVLVESLGQLRDPKLDRYIWEPITGDSALTRQYALRKGTLNFRGGTTSGELRELCGVFADYLTLPSERIPSCLPVQLQMRGYETFALHGYHQRFYGRGAWYHQLFQHVYFEEQMDKVVSKRRCGTVFRGVCDADVFGVAAHILRGGNRRFVYVVTLESHLPREFDTEVRIWRNVIQSVADIARAGNTRVLIVGDHAPPYGHPLSDAFEPGVVSFMEMTPR